MFECFCCGCDFKFCDVVCEMCGGCLWVCVCYMMLMIDGWMDVWMWWLWIWLWLMWKWCVCSVLRCMCCGWRNIVFVLLRMWWVRSKLWGCWKMCWRWGICFIVCFMDCWELGKLLLCWWLWRSCMDWSCISKGWRSWTRRTREVLAWFVIRLKFLFCKLLVCLCWDICFCCIRY